MGRDGGGGGGEGGKGGWSKCTDIYKCKDKNMEAAKENGQKQKTQTGAPTIMGNRGGASLEIPFKLKENAIFRGIVWVSHKQSSKQPIIHILLISVTKHKQACLPFIHQTMRNFDPGHVGKTQPSQSWQLCQLLLLIISFRQEQHAWGESELFENIFQSQ